jgi:hypothetical protein
MQTREYRRNLAATLLLVGIAVLFLAVGLFLIIAFFFPPHAGARPARLVFGLLALPLAAVSGAAGILGRRLLLVTEDGLCVSQTFRRRVIPWSSVRSFTVEWSNWRWYVVYVMLNNGEQVLLGDPRYGQERAEWFAAELTEALREHRGQAG